MNINSNLGNICSQDLKLSLVTEGLKEATKRISICDILEKTDLTQYYEILEMKKMEINQYICISIHHAEK